MENSQNFTPNNNQTNNQSIGAGGGVVSGVRESSDLDELINEFKTLENDKVKSSPEVSQSENNHKEVSDALSDMSFDEPENTSVIKEGEKYTLSQEENDQIEKYLLGADEDDEDVVEYVEDEDEDSSDGSNKSDADDTEEVEEEVEEEVVDDDEDDDPVIIEDDFDDDDTDYDEDKNANDDDYDEDYGDDEDDEINNEDSEDYSDEDDDDSYDEADDEYDADAEDDSEAEEDYDDNSEEESAESESDVEDFENDESETEEDDDETTEDYSELDEDEEPEIEDNDEENVETLASDEDKKVADVTEEGKEESKEDKIVNQEEVHGTQNETSEVAQPQSTKTESVSQVVEKQPVDQIAQPVQQQSVQQTAQPVAQTPTEPVVEKQATSYTEPQYVAKNQTEPVVENPQQYVPVQQPVESQVQQNYVPQSAPQVVQSQPTDQQNANYTQPQYVAQTQTEPVAEQTQQYVPVQQPVEQAQQPAKQYVQAHQPTVEQPQQYVQVQQPAGQANQSTQQYIPVQPTEPAGQAVQYVQPSTPIDATNYSVEAETNKEVADNQSAQNVQPTEPIRYFASATTEPNNEPNQSQAQRVIIPLGVDAGESSEKPNLKENTEKYISVDESNSENDEQYEEPEYEDIEYTYTNTETSPEGSIKPVTIVSGIGLNDQNEEKSENIDERSPEMKALEDRLYARIMSALTEMNITPTEAREAISNATNTVVLPEEEVTLDLTKFSGKVETFVPLESIPQATWEDVVKRKGHHTYHVTCAKSGGYFIKKAKSTSPYAFVELKDEALEVAIAYAKREKAELKIHDAKGVIEQSMSFGKEKKKSNKK